MSNIHTLVISQLIIIAVISLIFTTHGLTMRMIPIDSPHLQIVPKRFTIHERLQHLSNISMSRIYNHRKNVAPDSFRSPVIRARSSYFATQIGLGEGNTANYPYLLLDTGSDVTWIQCDGCNPCIEIRGNNFAYKRSTSFRRVSLNDPLCYPPRYYRDGSCGLSIVYGNMPPHVTASGLLGRETFYFRNSRTNNIETYPGLLFMCGLEMNVGFGRNMGPENIIAGVYGLSKTPRSLLSQLDAQTQGRFSYCLPPVRQLTTAESTLYLGDDAQISGDASRQVQTISMYIDSDYYLSLSGISVNGDRLLIDPSIFEYDPFDAKKGFKIDSGTPYSILARSAYDPLKKAIAKYLSDTYGWQPRPPGQVLDFCYSLYPGYQQLAYPVVVLHFVNLEQGGEIDMVLTREQLFVDTSELFGENHGLCMMVLPIDDPGPSMLGAYQQVNYAFLYDVHNLRLSFVPQNC